MEGLLRRVYSSKGLTRVLKIASGACVIITLPAFALLIIKSFLISYVSVAALLVITGVPFVAVSLMRKLLDLPRPYEIYDFYDTPPKKRCGASFPSRHVFSAFLIGTLALFYSVWLGASLLLCGLILSAARILLGIHFPRDCIAGAAVGIASAVIGVLIANPFI